MTIEDFIAKYWGKPGGAEDATSKMFLTELAGQLGAPTPDPGESGSLKDYQFEGPVKSEAVFMSKHRKRMDLYKRDHFVLEAKQSHLKDGDMPPEEPLEETEEITDLFGNVVERRPVGGKRARRYDRLMTDARLQAERYILALPTGHRPPPFLIVADIGRSFELYFDYTGDGRGYGFFPDQQNYRIPLTALKENEEVGATGMAALALLGAIWLDPESVDPRRKAVAVTRDIAERLSRVAAVLEKGQRETNPGKADFELALGIEHTSLFLMRVLFCMFAEDVELLNKGSFTLFLSEAKDKSDQWWRSGLTELWKSMATADEANRFWHFGDSLVRYFNGNLFSSARVYDLPQEFKGELFEAAKRDWRSVEPAIFGTLLEQVLTDAERSKLGAHYTPRPYVQRLVNATIADVLTPEWHETRDRARALEAKGKHKKAVRVLADFHNRLTAQRVLDPACGTGNFLYVAMEFLLQLEGEVLELAAELGEVLTPAVHPNQLLGLELNPRAAVIAELVLWIGWLRHRLANHPEAIGDPVLPTLTNINFGTHGGYDAVLRRTASGQPDTENPSLPDWPEADFIVGNPPFIGGKDIRAELTGEYAEALWAANANVPPSADFVMHWWDRAAELLRAEGSELRRFGFVTTNSVTQEFSRRVVARHLDAEPPLSLILACPDHPWTKATKDAAAVRIAISVAERGTHDGIMLEVEHEAALDTDAPVIEYAVAHGRVHSRLGLGADTSKAKPLLANEGVCSPGVKLHGSGFKVSRKEAEHLGLGKYEGLDQHIRPYRNNSDVTSQPPHRVADKMVIDLFGLSEEEVRARFPELYQHIYTRVWDYTAYNKKTKRDEPAGRKHNRRDSYRDKWWIFGEPRGDLRPALEGLDRYIVTGETSKHRVFQFLPIEIMPDNKLLVIASDSAFHLGVLSSRIHKSWYLANAGMIGMYNEKAVWVKATCWDRFAFPITTADQTKKIAKLAEELDATRKGALDAVPDLTMTGIYNLSERIAAGEELTGQDKDRAVEARVYIVHRLHEQIDEAVADAYGWEPDLAPAEIVAKLVELNAARAAEETDGDIRWLRPDYQRPRFAPNRNEKRE